MFTKERLATIFTVAQACAASLMIFAGVPVLLALLSQVCGVVYVLALESIERRIVAERVVTPADWEQGHEIHRGATFNLAHTLTQMLHMRPRNRFEDLGGVYLVGGGTHPGSGLPVIFESAKISTRLLLEDLGLPSVVVSPRQPEEDLLRLQGVA